MLLTIVLGVLAALARLSRRYLQSATAVALRASGRHDNAKKLEKKTKDAIMLLLFLLIPFVGITPMCFDLDTEPSCASASPVH